ncbi:MAG: type II toxin-antitoxin system RelB/DinJ family antitoxin [Clostridia bacterium]|nr:type II toxin-antitoxin system RelB/DinJ family antitoxin [Clostridia bacterium]
MTQTTVSVRMDAKDKKEFEEFCEMTGMNISVAFNMFVKAVLREQKLPFEVKTDPFYSSDNIERLKRSIAHANEGKLTIHNVTDDE